MSKESFREKVTKNLLEDFKSEREKSVAQASRDLLQSAKVQQCLVLRQQEVIQFQRGFEAGIGRKLIGGQIAAYRKALRAFVKENSEPFPVDKTVKTREFLKLVKNVGLEFGVDIFYMSTNFKTTKENLTAFHKKHFKSNKARWEMKNKYDATAQGKTTHLDHGADGNASGLFGGVIGAFSTLQQENKDTVKDIVDDIDFIAELQSNIDWVWANGLNSLSKKQKADSKKEVLKLVTFARQTIKKDGDIRAGLSMLLTAIDAETNLKRANLEKQVQNAFIKAFEQTVTSGKVDYLNLEGSSSLYQKIEKFVVLDKFADNLTKNSNVSVKSNQKKSTKTNTKTKTTDKKSVKGGKVKPIPSRGKKARPAAVRQQAGSNIRLASLVGVINQKLPQTVKKNMTPPRLRNRTGRFANSVKVIDYARTPKGYPSLGYTYQKFPYQTFEPGYAQGTNERDPRKLIDYSIREIASQLAIGRFFTRRV